ncbi:MAG: chemotaxis protein CheA [Agarilytica sp.]
MSIDLSQFHQVFFEESFENVDIMESSLMELDPDEVDAEVINAIFRAAHSIKGGSATFGFKKISEFTHILETLLDQIRGGERGLSKSDVNLFLQSVDCLREMLALLQDGDDSDTELSRDVAAQFTKILDGELSTQEADTAFSESAVASEFEAPSDDSDSNINGDVSDSESSNVSASEEGEGALQRWRILFYLGEELLKTGNDPIRIIRELGTLGEIQCTTLFERMPKLSDLDPELNYCGWDICLTSAVDKSVIEEIFEWVVDESHITIERDNTEDADGALHAGDDESTFWSIEFHPEEGVLRTGNDPYKLFVALETIGVVKSVTAHSRVPNLDAMDSELCYLSWTILLDAGEHDESKIREIFEWVEDEAKIDIQPVSGVFNDAIEQETVERAPVDETNAASSADNIAASDPGAEIAEGQNAPTNNEPSVAAKSPKAPQSKAKPVAAESSSIRVGIDKVDNLINMVGELVITQSMLGQLGTDFDLERLPKLLEGLSQLEQNTRELQESVMRIRMLPISFVFSRFPRMVRDLSQTLGKDINLEIIGDSTELDKTVLEKIGDPLVHLVRNAVDHGIETEEDRIAKGKSGQGTVKLNAYHQGGNVVIEVLDDGKGLDPDMLKQKAIEKGILTSADAESLSRDHAFDFIFQPGFSTAKEISDVSGRGVGMDVVKRNIQSLNGAIDIKSEFGAGSTITIRLPLTLAILDGQLVRVANQTYIFPIVSIVESLQCKSEYINKVAGGCSVFRLRDEYVPIIQLAKTFDIPMDDEDLDGSLMVVVESEGEKVGIVVDELLAQQQVVIKSLENNYKRVKGVSGATILGDGTVALIVDIPGIVRLAGDNFTLMQNAAQSLVAQLQQPASQRAGL